MTKRAGEPTVRALRAIGVHARVQRWLRRHLWRMDIHPSARIDASAYIDLTWPRGVHIAADCRVDQQAVVLAHDYTRGLYLDTHIGERTHIGARAIVMPGLAIGPDCEIAPGAVVTRDMPANSFAIGNPAEIQPR